MKDQSEKDKYLFKRRDEPNGSKTHKIIRGQTVTSSQSLPGVGSVIPVKGMPPAVVDHASQTSVSTMAEVLEQSPSQPAVHEELGGQEPVQDSVGGNFVSVVTESKLAGEGSRLKNDSGKKKGKLNKRPAGESTLESSVPVEKHKKRKKQIGTKRSSDHLLPPGIAGKGGAFAGQVGEKPVYVPSVLGDNSIASKWGASAGLVGEKPVDILVVHGENSDVKHLGNDGKGKTAILPDTGATPTVADKSTQLELPELLKDLHALALNPFLSSESCYPANLVQVFVRFRSLVYQKSLSSLSSGENESKEVRGIFPSPTASFDNPPDNMREMSSVRPKPPGRLEDPTKGGRKRGPSDRQEEMTLKKKKKINDMKLLVIEKKAAQRAPEVRRDGKEMSAKTMGQTPEKKAASKPPEVLVGDGRETPRKPMAAGPAKVFRSESAKKREPPARAADPTMLVMKFPPEAALPSPAELKVKFARFGPLDHSGTRIFWKSSTIRLVYLHKNDAQAALKFAASSSNLFGNTNVRCHLRDLGVETPETESKVEPNIGMSQSKDPPVLLQQRLATSIASQANQLKSCLKKPPGDEGPSTAGAGAGGSGNGNGNSRGRVKFMLGDEGSVRTSSDDGASSHGLNINSEKIHMVNPPPPPIIPLPVSTHHHQQMPIAPNNYHHTELVVPRNVQSLSIPAAQHHIDISQQMISLLTKCKDVVNNLTGTLGYVPYHPL